MKRLILLLLILLVVAVGCTKEQKEIAGLPAENGNPAPDFSLSGPNGETRLSTLKGKLVLVHFWATWCPPCREELPSLAKLNKAISIDKEGNDAVQKLFSGLGITLPVLLDSSSRVAGQYGTTGVPETFIVSPEGIIIKKIVGSIEWSSPEVISFLNNAMKTGH